jgi:outer membrane protein assembly factor BamB
MHRRACPRGLYLPLVLILPLLVVLPPTLGAETASVDWPQFRGRHRDGVSPETGLLHAWPAEGPRELWRRPIGEGYSSVAAAGGRLYTMYAAADGDRQVEVAAAFDAATGDELWRTVVGPKIETEFGNGPRSTPAVDGDLLFVLGSHGDFAALATADGAKKWSLSLPATFQAQRPFWGYATSALVDGGLVIVESGGHQARCYAALDKSTGDTRWTAVSAPAGYNSLLPATIDGHRQLVYVAGPTIGAFDLAGRELWTYPTTNTETHAMPLFVPPDQVFVSGVGGEGATLLKVHPDGGAASVEPAWSNPSMRNHFSASLYYEGTVYGFDNATLKAISAATGEVAWSRRGLGRGSLIAADGHLIVLSDRCKLLLAEATPDAWRERGAVQALDDKCWTPPALAGGRLYLRNHTEMVCYDLKG